MHTLQDRRCDMESDDYTALYNIAPALDVACEDLGVRRLTEFFDYTDQQRAYSLDEVPEDEQLDPETGLAYGIEDMAWFDAGEGVATMTALRERLRQAAVAGVDANLAGYAVDELDQCLARLETVVTVAGKFHLAVIE